VSSDKLRVLVVDDSAFMRRLTSQIIIDSGEFAVAGTARNGYDALKQIHELNPDIVTLDVDMPELDGLSALGYIMSETPRPVVMLSAGTTNGGHAATLRALELGAVDFVLKPSGAISLDLRVITERLLDALRGAASANMSGLRMLARPVLGGLNGNVAAVARATRAVVVASSTGGPRALAAIVPQLPRGLAAAVLVVQHMPAGFTKSLAQRLDTVSPIRIDEAEDGEPVVHGRMYIAPGGFHMTVRDAGDGPVIGASTVAVVLTGMGRDGAEGTRAVREAGGRALIQDRETATIFGMPQAALERAGADRVVPLSDVGSAIAEFVDAAAHVP
jgi:two-component system chemotaxis response regulator CheB